MAKLLVIGASRGIGLERVKAALRAGHRVLALARSAASIPIRMRVWIRCPATRSIATRSGTHSKVSTWLSRHSALISPLVPSSNAQPSSRRCENPSRVGCGDSKPPAPLRARSPKISPNPGLEATYTEHASTTSGPQNRSKSGHATRVVCTLTVRSFRPVSGPLKICAPLGLQMSALSR
jgi:hypothetical protein